MIFKVLNIMINLKFQKLNDIKSLKFSNNTVCYMLDYIIMKTNNIIEDIIILYHLFKN